MKINTIKAYMIKEFMELWRTRLIVMVYLMPVMIVVLFGYGIRMDVSHARILIIDNDQSKYSMQLVSKFEHTKYFNTTISQMSEKEALHSIKQAKTDAILIIPSSFEKRLLHGQKSELGVFVDASCFFSIFARPTLLSPSQDSAAGEVAAGMGSQPKGSRSRRDYGLYFFR